MSNLAKKRKYTYKDYITWDSDIKYELIDGDVYAMASPSTAHQHISMELSGRLWQFLKGKSCEVFTALDVRLNADIFDDTVVQPDILVVCDKSKINGKSIIGAPDLIIEILSPSNTAHDTVRKYRQYQKAGVREYWIINPVYKVIQACILENGKYVVSSYSDDDIIPVHILEGCEISLADIFYGSIESDSENNELELRKKIIQAFKETGVNDEQIEKAVKILNENRNREE